MLLVLGIGCDFEDIDVGQDDNNRGDGHDGEVLYPVAPNQVFLAEWSRIKSITNL